MLRFLKVIMILFVPLGLCSQVSEQKLNVLFIIADDLSTNMGCYGVEEVQTPHLDQLASEGMRFDRAYCQASLCNPSRSSLMTGRRPHELGILANATHFRGVYPRIVTLPEHFKNNGYHSVGIGKIFHNWGQAIEGDPISWSEPQVNHYAAHYHDWYLPERPYAFHFDISKGPAVQRADVPDEAYVDGRTTRAAISKLAELQETPFFLAVGFWKPHLPFNAPAKYWELYEPDNLPKLHYPAPVSGVPEIAYVHSNEARSYTDVRKEGEIPEAQKRELRLGYLAAISYLDAQVGKLLQALEEFGLSENTIVVFLSDHGFHAGEHGQFGKWTNFEQGARVPLIIRAPGMAGGQASESIVELIDLYPTLSDLCNLTEPDPGLSGISLKSLLHEPDNGVKNYSITQISRPLGAGADYHQTGSSIRDKRWRYNLWTNRSGKEVIAEELYDLSGDIFKVDNLAENPDFSEVKRRLNSKLLEATTKN